MMSRPIQHNAPAGQKYSSILDAGEQTLATYCQKFPKSPDRESFILPILFKSEHPENVKEDDGSLSEADKKLLKGLNNNIRGERGEYEVYKVFYTLVRQSPTESVLVIHGYGLDNDNGRGLKKHAIISELPTVDLSGVKMKMEHDFVVIVRYIGIVLCEVKTSASGQNISSAESQLKNSDTFVKQIMSAFAGPTAPELPTVKFMMVPNEVSTPSSPKKHNDCHVIYQDDLKNFSTKWKQIVKELKSISGTSVISPNSFENLVQFLVGVWTMKCMTKKTYDFNNDNASLSADIPNIDLTVNRAEFALTKQAQRLTTNIATSMNEVFQRVDDLNVMYLSPEQKSLYDNYKHALIHSHAGTGKTMLIIFKIIELLEADPTQKCLLVAPYPHYLRLQQILNKHNITTDIVTGFPYAKPKTPTSNSNASRYRSLFNHLPRCDVLIIPSKNFFAVSRQRLMEYDVSKFHLFVDDMHSCNVSGTSLVTSPEFTDIGDFIDNTYNLLSATDHYAWFAFDVVQQGDFYDTLRIRTLRKSRSDRLFMTSDGGSRTFSIPVVTMKNVLRSTKEINDVIHTVRQMQMKFNEYDTEHVISDLGCGHHITTGTRVLYDKLQQNTERKHWIPFVCDRVCSLLRNLTGTTSPQPNNFSFSSVAILFTRANDLQEYKPSLLSMIKQQFKVGVQSIEEQLLSNNDDDIVIDHSTNLQSFESSIVVVLRTWGNVNSEPVLYNVLSRARTFCALVDVAASFPPLSLQHIDLVVWKAVEHNNSTAFKKL